MHVGGVSISSRRQQVGWLTSDACEARATLKQASKGQTRQRKPLYRVAGVRTKVKAAASEEFGQRACQPLRFQTAARRRPTRRLINSTTRRLDGLRRLQSSPVMAIARPVRVLFFAAAVLWCLFLYRAFRPSSGLRGPGERYVNFERDPNLDRSLLKRFPLHSHQYMSDFFFSFLSFSTALQLPENRQGCSSALPTSMRPTLWIPIASMPLSWHLCETPRPMTWSRQCWTWRRHGITSSTTRGPFSTTNPSQKSLRRRPRPRPRPSAITVRRILTLASSHSRSRFS